MKRFRLTFTCVSVLGVEDIWPDGDAPAEVTSEDVANRVRSEGGPLYVLDEWNLWSCDGDWNVEEEK